jgi:serine/threonine protein kinase
MLNAACCSLTPSLPQLRSAPLDESHARFYAASVVCGLQYLHDRELVYRDLKVSRCDVV